MNGFDSDISFLLSQSIAAFIAFRSLHPTLFEQDIINKSYQARKKKKKIKHKKSEDEQQPPASCLKRGVKRKRKRKVIR
jgi:hypothetical protein